MRRRLQSARDFAAALVCLLVAVLFARSTLNEYRYDQWWRVPLGKDEAARVVTECEPIRAMVPTNASIWAMGVPEFPVQYALAPRPVSFVHKLPAGQSVRSECEWMILGVDASYPDPGTLVYRSPSGLRLFRRDVSRP